MWCARRAIWRGVNRGQCYTRDLSLCYFRVENLRQDSGAWPVLLSDCKHFTHAYTVCAWFAAFTDDSIDYFAGTKL